MFSRLNGRTVCEAPLKEKLPTEVFLSQAEDGNFCSGEWPKIAAHREAEQSSSGIQRVEITKFC